MGQENQSINIMRGDEFLDICEKITRGNRLTWTERFADTEIFWYIDAGPGYVSDPKNPSVKDTADIYYTAAERIGIHIDFYITEDMNQHGYKWPHPYHRLVIAAETDKKTFEKLQTLATDMYYDNLTRNNGKDDDGDDE